MANLEAGMSFDIDICELYNDNEFMEQWPNFKDEIYENPISALNCMKLGIHQVCLLLHINIFLIMFVCYIYLILNSVLLTKFLITLYFNYIYYILSYGFRKFWRQYQRKI